MGEDNCYTPSPDSMDKAAEFYRAGRTGVMKKWPEIVAAQDIFDQEVQSAKDVFADSADELKASFPEATFQEFCKQVLNEAGVLFKDAGRRSQNPYRRTAEQQARIGAYIQKMAVLWVRIKAAVITAQFNKFVRALISIANRLENAARWAVQEKFPDYPVFVGPVVSADVMMAGFQEAQKKVFTSGGQDDARFTGG